MNYQERWWMLETLTGKTKAQLLANPQDLTAEQQKTLDAWIYERTVLHKPLQYILGSVSFAGLNILVEPPILIPRPETEEMVLWILAALEPIRMEPLRILDLCTGTGCIALALAHALPNATVVGVDIDPQAVALAEKNRVHNGVSNASFYQSDLFSALYCSCHPGDCAGSCPSRSPGSSLGSIQFDLIVSNPPYVTVEEYAGLEPEVKEWESKRALVADGDGLLFYKRIAQEAWPSLHKQSIVSLRGLPRIICEIGTNSTGVEQAFLCNNYSKSRLSRDMQGHWRWVAAWV